MQSQFLDNIEKQLKHHELNPVNLGRNNWSYKTPLTPIKNIMSDCKAAVIIGLERSHSFIGYEKEGSKECKEYVHRYQSSPWIQIEAGMAYQAGLPLLILKEDKLLAEGILDPKVSEFFIFEFNLDKVYKSLSKDINEVIDSWVKDFKF